MKFFVLFLTFLLFLSAWNIEAKDDVAHDKNKPSGESMLFDLLFLRPIGIATCALGIAASIVSIPFNLGNPNPQYVGQRFIEEPFEYTFLRPLGKISTKEE